MNKRVKIVALGLRLKSVVVKKFGEDGYWGEKLDVEASAQNIAKLIEAGQHFPFQLPRWPQNKVSMATD